MSVFTMKKLRKFSLQLPGRKHSSSTQNESFSGITSPISKAQRILGTESIDLNISPPVNSILYQKCDGDSLVYQAPRIRGFRQGISADNRPVRQYANVLTSEPSQNYDDSISIENECSRSDDSQQESPIISPQEFGTFSSANQCARKVKIIRTRPVIHVAKCVSDSFLESQKRFGGICTRKTSQKKLRPVSHNFYDDRPVTSASWIETQACRIDASPVDSTLFDLRKSDISQTEEFDSNKDYLDFCDSSTNILAPSPTLVDEKRPEAHSNTSDGSIPIFFAYSETSSETPSVVSSLDLTETSILSLTIDSDEEADSFPVYLGSIKSCTPAIQETPPKKMSPTIPEFLDVLSSKDYEKLCFPRKKYDNLTPELDPDEEKLRPSHSVFSDIISQYPSHFPGLQYPKSSQGPPSPPSSINSQSSAQNCRIMNVTEEERALLETLRLQKAQMQSSPIDGRRSPADFRRLAIAI